jgi:4-diphosphocytidyl-2-C-methyl-D-erythritol kinase
MTFGNTEAVTVRARAKVNLYLHVLGRREDGYHEIDSLFVFTDLADVVEVRPAKSLRLRAIGPFAKGLPPNKDNLMLRAARLLADAAEVRPGASVTLTKNLPIAAGLGGGSADAAAMLRALMKLWRIPIGAVDLPLLGLGLGADIPTCLLSAPCFVGGVGELIERAPALPPMHIVLVNPGVELSTASVFTARKQVYSKKARFTAAPRTLRRLVALLENRCNDLEPSAIKLCPVIADVLDALRRTEGCALARMSGRGASGFGLYEEAGAAALAAGKLRARGWWAETAELDSAEFSVTD